MILTFTWQWTCTDAFSNKLDETMTRIQEMIIIKNKLQRAEDVTYKANSGLHYIEVVLNRTRRRWKNGRKSTRDNQVCLEI